jgi:hypothetical protein
MVDISAVSLPQLHPIANERMTKIVDTRRCVAASRYPAETCAQMLKDMMHGRFG